MYDDPVNLRSIEIKVRLRPDEARLLAALADYNRTQRAVLARDLLLEQMQALIESKASSGQQDLLA